MAKTTVLVTGGDGFLGQFIVKLLQEKDDEVTDIRILDCNGFKKRLAYKDRVPVEIIKGDVRNMETVLKACETVDCVIHAAALIDVSLSPDAANMQAINTEGTRNIINACLQQHVKYLVYTSTVDVVIGKTDLPHVKETQAPIPQKFLLSHYPATKYAAEELVLKADKTQFSNGLGKLRTLALRPVVTYGEGDPYFVTNSLRSAAKRGGTLLRVHRDVAIMQSAYVGNIAWAHLVARNALKSNPDKVSGLPYFIDDDTIPDNAFEFLKPFLEERGMRVSSTAVPYWLFCWLLTLGHWLLNIINLVYEPPFKLPPLAQITYVCKVFVVSRMRATYRLRYSPIYRPDEAMARSMTYYKQLPL